MAIITIEYCSKYNDDKQYPYYTEPHPLYKNSEDYIHLISSQNTYKDITIYRESCNSISQLLSSRAELFGTNREKLLSTVQNYKLAVFVNEVYRPGASVGDGGTADMLILEFYLSDSKHLTKAQERLIVINKIINSEPLGLNDLDIAEALRDDLKHAISLFK